MVRSRMAQVLMAASFATLVASAGAQPYGSPAQGNSVVAVPDNTSGTTVYVLPDGSRAYPNGKYPDNSAQWSRYDANTDQMRAYMDARQYCTSLNPVEQIKCDEDTRSRFGSIDFKCEKLSGPALSDCLHGDDHGQ